MSFIGNGGVSSGTSAEEGRAVTREDERGVLELWRGVDGVKLPEREDERGVLILSREVAFVVSIDGRA